MLESDFKAIFNPTIPRWKEFINILLKYKERMANHARDKNEGFK